MNPYTEEPIRAILAEDLMETFFPGDKAASYVAEPVVYTGKQLAGIRYQLIPWVDPE